MPSYYKQIDAIHGVKLDSQCVSRPMSSELRLSLLKALLFVRIPQKVPVAAANRTAGVGVRREQTASCPITTPRNPLPANKLRKL
mmetsp:Transcript_99543/g.242105  ORF Transcript_99543/g.242105 Transcript_99543/m.242105 type:complete len:85 (+) Transcript_99543:134-388(+)